MQENSKIFFFCTAVFLWNVSAFSQTFRLQGQLSGWAIVTLDQSSMTQGGLRYIPGLSIGKEIKKKYTLDAEFSANIYASGLSHSFNDVETEGRIKPYRMWLRFSIPQFEARLGLQKINFGSATLLRPLMWFDRMDPRDPLQLTDGVYGFLVRYYFLNNTNVWLWGLYGNSKTKGWEMIPSDDRTMEYGGRIQWPLFTGEMAFTVHHRRMNLEKGILEHIPLGKGTAPENRFGVDGKWDVGVGVWFEGTLIQQDAEAIPFPYIRSVNIGADYTFGLRNGLHFLAEHFFIQAATKPFGSGEGYTFSAVSLNYPFGLLDNATAMLYYDWKSHDWYRFMSWQRMYDRWSIYTIAFWNPDYFQIYQNVTGTNIFAGKGFQCMIVINH